VLEVAHRRVIQPLIDLLRVGTTPRRLAWSLAVGAAIGVNPLLGSTTLICLAAAFLFRLNLVASQIANHLMYPFELLLFFFFIRMGDHLFHTGHMPMRHREIFAAASRHPWDTTRLLWSWEWHALVVWLLCALVATPLLALLLTPLLKQLAHRTHILPEEPIVR